RLVRELFAGEIKTEPEAAMKIAAHCSDLMARPPHNLRAKPINDTDLLRQRDELVRFYAAKLRVVPTGESFETLDLARRKRIDRLVRDADLLPLDGPPQVGLEA